ncbi:glycoside hydrolase family 2 [Niabella ginsenosidivorans]|uniref:Glycoside hydrolase family 2 n=1 Tax=Niabella ginsenosidivorans TaxID=1176587 RepID=A0A1A9I8F6_9BACT|nr:glycoside hydrolase family 2 [Niabella ginsenosidivorans]ANH83896.1 glycoside hydrolase family 2 [Niabella ginsenosidivorans]
MKQFLFCCFLFCVIQIRAQQEISLAGTWKVRLDKADRGVAEQWFSKDEGQPVKLPGTLDDAGIGEQIKLDTNVMNREVMIRLTRKHTYIGPAWYSRQIVIPAGWNGKVIRLCLERVIWNTQVWIDGREAGTDESLSTPHVFELSKYLTPGKHLLTLRIDNRKQHDISYQDMAHAYTDGTQIIWNGVIGAIELSAGNQLGVAAVQAYPDAAQKSVGLKIKLENLTSGVQKAILQATVFQGTKRVGARKVPVTLPQGTTGKEIGLTLNSNTKLWDEFDPQLCRVAVALQTAGGKLLDRKETRFGIRTMTSDQQTLRINGRPVFLRGTLECNIFPLTGHPPMTREGWLKVFRTAKSYGLNHLRFHSWCPPEAAFEVADSIGFYLQVELPFWSKYAGKDTATNRFLEKEAKRISETYGNHPSFCLWSLGNELQGDFNWLHGLLTRLRQKDNRHLYTTTTFTFQKDHGRWPEAGDDFFITQYTKKGWVRGQGVFNDHAPDFSTDYTAAVEGAPVPLITHEIGQYSVYPNLREINKYTGVLDPLNFKAVRNDLRKKHLLQLADSFTLASGIFAAQLYKEEMERALKTNGISGYQLLDLHDFPGQGTALVGILDAFWDSKQLVRPEEHRMYSSAVVPLLRFSKAVYTNDEAFEVTAAVANFSAGALKRVLPQLIIKDRSGKILFTKEWQAADLPLGNSSRIGEARFALNSIKTAETLTIELLLKGTEYKNKWRIWVYPATVEEKAANIFFTRSFTEARRLLEEGRNVLFNPDTAALKGVSGRFAPVFWSPVHFPDQPGTMGILCNPEHPALQQFPTAFHSDWQWWELITSSKTMIIDSLPDMTPVVRVIDNFFKNRKMANVFEARVGKGKLLMTSINIADRLEERPAARQLRYSLLQYMKSAEFKPETVLTTEQLLSLKK